MTWIPHEGKLESFFKKYSLPLRLLHIIYNGLLIVFRYVFLIILYS